jgi:ferrous iron transport protein A
MWQLNFKNLVFVMLQESPVKIRLSKLPTGSRALIVEHEESAFRLTLMEMGCIPGEPVWVEMVAPMGDPIALRIAGYHLSIRKEDADKIWVTIIEPY